MNTEIAVGSTLLPGPVIWFLPVQAEVCPWSPPAPAGKHVRLCPSRLFRGETVRRTHNDHNGATLLREILGHIHNVASFNTHSPDILPAA